MAGHRGIVLRLLTWNLFHGRDFPPDPALFTWRSRLLRVTELGATHAQVNRPLLGEFAGWLARAEWDVALLQEAPPRWAPALARRTGAAAALALTSRNSVPSLRAALARCNPDLIASGEGGSNQLLVRGDARLLELRRMTLTRRPERRRMLWARVGLPGGRSVGVANLHATAGDPAEAAWEVERAAERAVGWAGALPLVFGGDLNLRPRRSAEAFALLRDRFGLGPPTAPDAIDHLLVRELELAQPPRAMAPEARDVPGPHGLRLRLSDHAPVVATVSMR
jgi:endonuclease/exonuclease/phosphatase family metal-dependent hydrolase